MQRISVDLPEPDGPQMTIRSPFATLRSTSRSTWNCPYHLLTFANSMIGSVAGMRGLGGSCYIAAGAGVEMPLDPLAVARHREAEHEIDGGDEELPFEEELAPVGVAQRELQRAGQVVEAHDRDERGVLERADERVHDRRNDEAQRLRQHDLARRSANRRGRARPPPRPARAATPAARRARPRRDRRPRTG